MSKIKHGMILLFLCFSLSFSVDLMVSSHIAYANPPENEQEEFEQENDENSNSSDRRLINSLNNKVPTEDLTGKESESTTTTVDDPKQQESSTNLHYDKVNARENNVELQPEPKDNDIFHIILAVGEIFNLIFTALVAFVFYTRFSPLLKKNNQNLSTNKINGNKVNGNKVNGNVQQISERTEDKLTSSNNPKNQNRDYSRINFVSSNKGSVNSREIDANNKPETVNSKSLDQNNQSVTTLKIMDYPINEDKSNKNFSTRPTNVYVLTREFKKMLNDVSTAESWQSQSITENFAFQYGVIAFKCVNSSMRVNHPETPPKFEKSTLDNKLWGIPLADGRLAVFPNPSLSDYEYSIHYQGGMKELFKVLVVPHYTPYEKGRYTKIKLETPAIVLSNFQIVEQGELHLM